MPEPPIPPRVFSVDAESDGLYGPVWAIGAVVLDDTAEVDRFAAMIDPADHVTDPWVREHIVPVVDLPRLPSRSVLLDAFWRFWMSHRENTICVADFAAPVEARLFRDCIEADPARRCLAPYPLHELGTALLCAGIDPDIDRREFSGRLDLTRHDPAADALAAGLCWRQALGTVRSRNRSESATTLSASGITEDSVR